MKITISMFLGMVLFVGHATAQVYLGGSMGSSNLNYNTEGFVYEKISTNNTASSINTAVQILNGDVNITSDNTAAFKKIFVGKRLNRFFGLEMFYMKTQGYSVDVDINTSGSVGFYEGNNNNNISVGAVGNISGSGQATADFKGYGLRVNGFIPINKKLDILVAVGAMVGTSTLTTEYQVSGSTTVNGEVNAAYVGSTYVGPANTSGSSVDTTVFNVSDTENSTETLVVPTIAIGVDYKLTNDFSIRSEVEMFGIPVNGLGIIVFSTGLQYTF